MLRASHEFANSRSRVEDRKKKPRFPFFAGYGRYVKPRIGPDPGDFKALVASSRSWTLRARP
jgi:hypothetical protein